MKTLTLNGSIPAEVRGIVDKWNGMLPIVLEFKTGAGEIFAGLVEKIICDTNSNQIALKCFWTQRVHKARLNAKIGHYSIGNVPKNKGVTICFNARKIAIPSDNERPVLEMSGDSGNTSEESYLISIDPMARELVKNLDEPN